MSCWAFLSFSISTAWLSRASTPGAVREPDYVQGPPPPTTCRLRNRHGTRHLPRAVARRHRHVPRGPHHRARSPRGGKARGRARPWCSSSSWCSASSLMVSPVLVMFRARRWTVPWPLGSCLPACLRASPSRSVARRGAAQRRGGHRRAARASRECWSRRRIDAAADRQKNRNPLGASGKSIKYRDRDRP